MKIALCQINPIVADFEGNARLIIDYYTKASAMGADLCVFPELALTGYPPLDMIERKDFVDKSLDVLNKFIVPKIKSCGLLIGSINHNTGAGKPYHNSAFFIDNQRIIYVINKQLLPTYDLFDERRYYEEGKGSSPVYYKGLRLGIHVCEDMWRNESSYSQKLYDTDPVDNLGEKGVDILINLSASPFARAKDAKRQRIMSGYASKWKVPFLMVNTVGANDSIVFDGRSKVLDSTGKLVHELKSFNEDIYIFDTDKFNYSENPKYSDIETVQNALVLGLKDYMEKNELEKIVIGLSGGIDSAVCTVLARDAVGAENITCITMPTRYSSKSSVTDSVELCKNLGVKLDEVNIDDAFSMMSNKGKSLIKGLGSAESGFCDDAMENIQPRIRGLILMAYANTIPKSIVIAPGNKSEIAVGYCTIYGDTCGALALIGDLYKTEVYELAAYMNIKKELIPKAIIEKHPSAELKPNQRDTDSLPPYPVLDEILKLYIEEQFSPEEIYKKVKGSTEVVDQVINMVLRNEFKRKQLAPVIRVSSRAFILDRRWPVVHKFR
jgi:NAD+ synthase (glutamine-hydrolysing)